MNRPQRSPVPGLTRDLSPDAASGGPGSGPGRDSSWINQIGPASVHGSLGLHDGVSSGRRTLCRTKPLFTQAGRSAPRWAVVPYRQIQDQDAGLVRSPRRFRDIVAARAADKTLAPGLERSTDSGFQSELEGHDTPDPLTATVEVPDQVRDGFSFGRKL